MERPVKFLASLSADSVTDMELIKSRISDFKGYGLDGFVFALEDYSDDIEYMNDEFIKKVSEIILFTKSEGLEIWLEAKPTEPPEVGMLSSWLEYDGGTVKQCCSPERSPFDYTNSAVLIDSVLERYKSGLSKEAYGYLAGFTSEVPDFSGQDSEYPAVPWYDELETEYTEEFDGDIFSNLKSLFEDNEDASEFKAWYWQKITDRMGETALISEWCKENEKGYFPQIKTNANPYSQVLQTGSALQYLRRFNLPSVSFSGKTAVSHFLPVSVSSLAKQFGSGTAGASVLGGLGWGIRPGEFEEYMTRLIECGINMFVFHTSFLHLNYKSLSRNQISFPTHITWKKVVPQILERLREKAEDETKRPHKILVVCPTRAIWEHFVPTSDKTISYDYSQNVADICGRLYEMNRRFDLTDEIIFEENADFSGGGMKLGEAEYGTLLTVPGASFSKNGMVAIERAKANGVRILNDIPKSDTEIIPLDQIRQLTKEVVPISTVQDSWTITLPKENRFLLESSYKDGSFICEFNVDDEFDSDLTLLVTDNNNEVSINNILVRPIMNDCLGNYYNITSNVLGGKNTVMASGGDRPVFCLVGDFKVTANQGYRGFDDRQVQTRYDFTVKNTGMDSENNMIRCGYPFCRDYVSAKKVIYIEENINKPQIKLDCSCSAVIEVFFDNESLGFVYEGSETLPLPSIAAEERHLIEIHCYPSAFNAFGRHRSLFGDSENSSGLNLTYGDSQDLKFTLWKIPRDIELIQEF